jgi:ABC-2 type transport system permease protein
MKMIDIASKDLKRTFLSAFSLVMMFAAPLLITGLLYFAFGGLTKGGSGYSLPVTKVVIANLDRPGTSSSRFAAGEMLVNFLQDPSLKDILVVSLASDEAQARAAVDGGKAGVGIIIPASFTAAAITPHQSAAVSLYQDPTLTIGPSIVKDLVSHFMDAFSGSKIASQSADRDLSSHGIQASESFTAQVAQTYAAWQQTSGHAENSAMPHLAVVSPGGESLVSTQKAVPIELITAGMIIFFVFFIGAHGAESIIREDEEGTLARMFTTSTSQVTILAGKLLGIVVSLCIQIVLLLAVSCLLFGIHWGRPATIILVSFSLIVAAGGFGILLMSFIKNSRQTGPVMGGVLTLLGMLGGMFTVALPNLPSSVNKVSLVTPHGWAMQGWKLALAGSSPIQVIVPSLVLLVMGLAFFAVGAALFHKRFA